MGPIVSNPPEAARSPSERGEEGFGAEPLRTATGEVAVFEAKKAPLHLWVVGALATLWNGFGAFDYVMSQARNEAYLANFTASQRAYIETFPIWMEAGWALGVWGALAGSLLLLARSRFAPVAFAVSLAGLATSSVYHFGIAELPPELQGIAMIALNLVIWAIAVGLLVYSVLIQSHGVYRERL